MSAVEQLSPSPARAGRSRWAAIGAAVAVTLGAGGALTTWASGSATPAVFVQVTPCRLLDTRSGGDTVGPRATPLAAGETYITAARGAVGNCALPADVSALSMNVTVIGPTAASFLTVFPADATRPTAANLNWVAGQPPTPNAVTAGLSADGKLAVFNLAGTVNVSVDVVGYYVPATQAVTDVSSDVVDLSQTIETVTSQIGALQTAVTGLAAPQEAVSTPVSVPDNLTAQTTQQTATVTTTTSGRWWISATYAVAATCSVGLNYYAFLLVDDILVRSTVVTVAGVLVDRVTFAGPTAGSVAAGTHTVKLGARCLSGNVSALTGPGGTAAVVNVMVLR
jgi:hypothetical protein